MDQPTVIAAQEVGLLNSEVSIVLLLVVAAAVAVAVRRIRLPYTVALVVVGLGLAFLPEDVIPIEVSADLILAVLVPPLLFEATLHISWARLRRDLVVCRGFSDLVKCDSSSSDFGDDFFGGLVPDEWFRVVVPGLSPVFDGVDELVDAGEAVAA